MSSTVPPATAPAAAVESAVPDSQEAKLHTDKCQPPTSPAAAQSVSQSLLDAKERRAYEVARQRAKHPEDRRKARGQKWKRGWLAGLSRSPTVGAADEETTATSPDTEGINGAREAQVTPHREAEGVCTAESNEDTGRVTAVRLEDLIRVAKVRKEKAGDFELIPRARAVLALDESDFAGDAPTIRVPEFDLDDWEHVESCSGTNSSDEDEPHKTSSYAEVASGVKH